MRTKGRRRVNVGRDGPGSPTTAAWTPSRALVDDGEAQELIASFVAAQRAVAAERASLERLLVPWLPVAERIAYAYARSETDAADMVHEALLSAVRHLPDLRDPLAFPQWFATLAHSACRQWLRRERQHRGLDPPGDPDETAASELVGCRHAHADAAFDAVDRRRRGGARVRRGNKPRF
jgi:DNA-directed RNA polymerase specialized sigma24 family protein